MPQIKIEVTARRKRILEALCLKHECTLESLFEGKMLDLEINAGGIDVLESPEDQDAAVVRLERKANKIDTDRKATREAEEAARLAAESAQTAETTITQPIAEQDEK